MARNERLRFLANNFNDSSVATITYSSQLSSVYAAANLRDSNRSKTWKPSGYFKVTTSNQVLSINDGSNKTAYIAEGEYSTPAALATAAQTALNSASSGWTVAYSTTTHKFTLSHASSRTLRHTETTNAAWDLLGFTDTADAVGTSFPAQEPRVHSEEWYQIDCGTPLPLTAFCLISELGSVFPLGSSATVQLLADNVPGNWSSPAYTLTLTPEEAYGIFAFLDVESGTQPSYRYWRFRFVDRMNAGGSSAFAFSHLYLGDYTVMAFGDIAPGFTFEWEDTSEEFKSEGCQTYYNERERYRVLGGCTVELMEGDERREIAEIVRLLGRVDTLYVALDPVAVASATVGELTAYGRFASSPRMTSVFGEYFSVSFDFKESA